MGQLLGQLISGKKESGSAFQKGNFSRLPEGIILVPARGKLTGS